MNARQFVKEKYYQAYVWRARASRTKTYYVFDHIHAGRKVIGEGETSSKAWQDAKNKITNKP